MAFNIIKCRLSVSWRTHNSFSSHASVSKYLEKSTELITGKHLLLGNKKVGLPFNITYIDECKTTTYGNNLKRSTVLMLHGAPGSFRDFEPQIDFMINQGARVIVPNFPVLSEMLAHRSPKFRNSPRNRAELIHDFLHFLGVKNVDMLVAHSTSVYTALSLQGDSERLSVKSMALLNSATYREGILKPLWLFRAIEWMTYNRFGYAFIHYFKSFFMKYLFSTGRYTEVDQPLTSLCSLTSRSPAEALSMLQRLVSSKLPVLFLFSENDRLVSADLNYDMVEVLGGNKHDVWIYDDKGKLQTKGNSQNNLRFVSFKNGSHYPIKKYPDAVNYELLQLLKRIQ